MRRSAFISFCSEMPNGIGVLYPPNSHVQVSAHFPLSGIVPCLVFVECYMEGDASVVFPGAQWLRERFLCDVGGGHEGPLIASNVSHPRRARLLR